MRAWDSVAVPSLARFGRAPDLRFHDTASGRTVTSKPDGAARLYVCGITPYDATHLGHAATYLAFDLLNRGWRDAGHEVRYIQNVTDIDDPLLERVAATGEDWQELAERETERFRGDMAALRVLPPDRYVGVVESVELIAAMVDRLRGLGHAYAVEEDWYFDVHADRDFGAVSGLDEETMVRLSAERGGDPERPGKRHPLDCLLWRGARPGEPSWDGPMGSGRPGWHVECSAIALHHLGDELDVQGGGNDLVFPHHEMSAAQVHAVDPGIRFARSYLHSGMVGYRGEKMSKSLGNLVFVSALRQQGTDPNVLRLALVSHHYREDWEWSDRDLAVAERRLDRWQQALAITSKEQAEQLVVTVRGALAADLDTPRALRLLDDWALGWHPGDGAGASVVRDLLDARLGITL